MTSRENVVKSFEEFAGVYKAVLENTKNEVNSVYSAERLRNMGKIYLVGDGVGFAAASGLKETFRAMTDLTGAWIKVLNTSEFAWQTDDAELNMGRNNVIVLDAGQNVSSEEAIARARLFQSDVTVISAGNEKGFSKADLVVKTGMAEKNFGGCGDYLRLFTAGFEFALMLSTAQDEENKDRSEQLEQLEAYVADMGKHMDRLSVEAEAIARKMSSSVRNFETTGTGLDYASALMIRDIVYNELGVVTTVEETEDYLHVNYLGIGAKEFGTFVINMIGNPCYDRTQLTVTCIQAVGRNQIVITDGEMDDYCQGEGTFIMKISNTNLYMIKAMFACVPAALVLASLKDIWGE